MPNSPEPIEYSSLSAELLRIAPEAREFIERERICMDDGSEAMHVTCGNFVIRWLRDRGEQGDLSDELIGGIAALMKRMGVSDERVQEVLWLSMTRMYRDPNIAPVFARHTDECLDQGIRQNAGPDFEWPPALPGAQP